MNFGIKQIGFCKKGTMATSPANVFLSGLRNLVNLKIEDIGITDEARDRLLVTHKRFTTDEIKLYQPNLLHLQHITGQFCPDGGADMELLTFPISSGVDNGCFQFLGAGNTHMGLKWRYVMNQSERFLGITPSVKLGKDAAIALINAADACTPFTSGVSDYGVDPTAQRYPWLNDDIGGVFGLEGIKEYSCVLEGIGDENGDLEERFETKKVMATVTLLCKNPSVANMVSDANEAAGFSFSFRQNNTSTAFDKIAFNQYVLHKKSEVTVGADRLIKQVYSGSVPLGNLGYSFTTANGGGTGQTGTEGGTLTLSH
jgi:hypothetical protein